MFINIKLALNEYIRENLFIFILCLVLFLVGIISGGIMAITMPGESRTILFDYLQNFFELMRDQENISSSQIFFSSLSQNLTLMSVIWLLGVTIIGIPLILLFVFMKGFLFGFSVTFLTSSLSFNGFLFSITSLLPHNLLFIPVFFLMSIAAIAFSIMLFRNHFSKKGLNVSVEILNYMVIIIATSVVTIFASLVEAYITPTFMSIVLSYI
ncbi:stage II sporulation protein M [Natranaerofaba carboxydovora]|uniref:stage II sporulation protein M n=1 Tax=Natranaerofaba carboxydovora TaxID=2742683 RepID=UPI001F12EF4C|nr:stage II sporulation protein M [Natranaerofaba carboxydovora]UMZ73928.1 Stage II sporulation protein M [Natranaerofaba carboxydovora]